MPPNGRSAPSPYGAKFAKCSGWNRNSPAPMNTNNAPIFSTTKKLFVEADSRMPIESNTESAMTKRAAKRSHCECATSQLENAHHGPLIMRLEVCAQYGKATPTLLPTSCKAAENCCATGAALIP